MNARSINFVAAHYILLTRSFAIILGCGAVWWGATAFPIFWRESLLDRIAFRITAGEPFRTETLARQLPIIEGIEKSTYCNPVALRSSAIFWIRVMEVAAAKDDHKQVDERAKSTASAIRRSLSCSPADPFLWLVLYWLDGSQDSFRSNNLEYLRMSYRLGLNEGWIALKRNRIAFESFQTLPSDLTEIIIDEFIALVENKLYEPAADIFIGPARAEQELILTKIERIPAENRRVFSDVLHNRGYDVRIPGITPRDLPPMH